MLTKKEQLRKNKSKKPSMKNKSKITSQEKAYLNWLQNQDLKCVVCGSSNMIEIHHLKCGVTLHHSILPKDHKRVIPVCYGCHRGNEISFHQNKYKLAQIVDKTYLIVESSKLHQRFLDEI